MSTAMLKSDDKRNFIQAFKQSLLCLEYESDRASIMRALKEFQNSMLVEDLVGYLKEILVTPQSLIIYITIFPLIPGRLRDEYRDFIPQIPSFEVKIIRIRKNTTESLGFSIRGGREHQMGIYITNVLPHSRAYNAGLKPGFQIIKVNAFPLKESTHEEVVSILTLKKSYILTCKNIGMIPEIRQGQVKWTYAEDVETMPAYHQTQIRGPSPFSSECKTLQFNLDDGPLGCSIRGGSEHSMGIFVTGVQEDSLAYSLGIKVGDQILEVNGKDFTDITHGQAAEFLKSYSTFIMKILPGNVKYRLRDRKMDEDDFPKKQDDAEPKRMWRESAGGQFILKKPEVRESAESFDVQQKHFEELFGEGSTVAPMFAHKVSGFGPSMALPGLTDLFSNMSSNYMTESKDTKETPNSGLIADVMKDKDIRRSISNFEEVISSSRKQSKKESETLTDVAALLGAMERKLSQGNADDDDDQSRESINSSSERNSSKPTRPGSRKTNKLDSQNSKKKSPTFKESVDIIGTAGERSFADREIGNPEKIEFSDEVLQGKKVVSHSIPKEGPLKFSIQGGIDTVHGGKILISHIQENGAAYRYGRLNIGDQILTVEGESLLNVTHDFAAQAIKIAMSKSSKTLDLKVAQIPGIDPELSTI